MDDSQRPPRRVAATALLLVLLGFCTTPAVAAFLLHSRAVEKACDQQYLQLYRSSFLLYVVGGASVVSFASILAILALPIRRLLQFAVATGTLVGLGCGAISFSLIFIVSAFPAVSPVAICYACRPWWSVGNCVAALCILGFSGVFAAWAFLDHVSWIQMRRLQRASTRA